MSAKSLSMPGSQSLLDIDLVLAVYVRSFKRYFEGMNQMYLCFQEVHSPGESWADTQVNTVVKP